MTTVQWVSLHHSVKPSSGELPDSILLLTGAPSLTGGRTEANILDQGHVADRGGGAAFFFLLPEKAT